MKKATFGDLKRQFRYSLSPHMSNDEFRIRQILSIVPTIDEFVDSSRFDSNENNMKRLMKRINDENSYFTPFSKGNRKDEAYISLEVTVILRVCWTSYYHEQVKISFDDFNEQYDIFQNCDESEKENLHFFTNTVRALLLFMSGKSNKEHILDVCSRVVDGYAVKRVIGSGMPLETKRRYYIVHMEGDIPLPSMCRFMDDGSMGGSNPSNGKSRGRPRKNRGNDSSDDSVDHTSGEEDDLFLEYNDDEVADHLYGSEGRGGASFAGGGRSYVGERDYDENNGQEEYEEQYEEENEEDYDQGEY